MWHLRENGEDNHTSALKESIDHTYHVYHRKWQEIVPIHKLKPYQLFENLANKK